LSDGPEFNTACLQQILVGEGLTHFSKEALSLNVLNYSKRE
jgi:hypothetical protein